MGSAHKQISFANCSNPSRQQSETWKHLLSGHLEVLEGRACQEFIEAIQNLRTLIQDVPNIKALSESLYELTGWQLAPVTGLLDSQEYFELLANKRHPGATVLRECDQLDVQDVPDIWHDVFGHLPLLFYPLYREFLQFIAQKWLAANDSQKRQLENVYWHTVEVGLCQENGARRVFGASQLASRNELNRALSRQVTVEPFNLEKILNLSASQEDRQSTFYELPSLDYLNKVKGDLDELIKT
jgi:phenylalanine-4-hydroxylase